jgi:hypothetical protein
VPEADIAPKVESESSSGAWCDCGKPPIGARAHDRPQGARALGGEVHGKCKHADDNQDDDYGSERSDGVSGVFHSAGKIPSDGSSCKFDHLDPHAPNYIWETDAVGNSRLVGRRKVHTGEVELVETERNG